jgi:hypothetical protein
MRVYRLINGNNAHHPDGSSRALLCGEHRVTNFNLTRQSLINTMILTV